MSNDHLHPIEGTEMTLEQRSGKQLEKALLQREQNFLSRYHLAKDRLEQLYVFCANRAESELRDEIISHASLQENISADDMEQAFRELVALRNEIRNKINTLRQEVNADHLNTTLRGQELISARLFSPETIRRCEHPESLSDHLVGAGVGALETTLWTAKLAGDVIWGLVKLPYDAYKIASKKGQYNGFKEI